MSNPRALAVMSCLLAATACTSVFTIDEMVSESAAITDDRLIGEWKGTEAVDRASIMRGPGKDYSVRYWDSDDTGSMRMRLGRLGPHLVIDVAPDPVEWKERDQGGIPTHMIFAVELRGDSLGLRNLNGDSVKKLLTTKALRVPYSTFNGGDIVLHGDPSGVKTALIQLFQNSKVQDDVAWYRRDKALSDSAMRAAVAERNAMIAFMRNVVVAQEVFFTDSNRYAPRFTSLSQLVKVPPTVRIKSFLADARFWNLIVTSSRAPGIECAIAVGTTNPLNSSAAEGEPICK